MSTDKIEIRLAYVNEEEVHLKSMSKDALNSFLSVAESLKNISEHLLSDDVTFSITKGSSCFAVHSSPSNINELGRLMNEAIQGNSSNQVVTDNMRRIQSEIQKPNFSYNYYSQGRDIADQIKVAKKITKKRVTRFFDYKVEVLTGLLNEIGGNEPNYHLDRGKGDKVTIACTIEEARSITTPLYEEMFSIVISKSENTIENKPTYQHCSILNRRDQVHRFRSFFYKYNSENDIINRLDCIYDFIYASKDKEEDILTLLQVFNNKIFDVNEIKTILIISKNIQDQNDLIKVQRAKLLSLFNSLLN